MTGKIVRVSRPAVAGIYGPDRFGHAAGRLVRLPGKPRFLAGQTVVIAAWVIADTAGIGPRFDPPPCIFPNLRFSPLAAYAAPLIPPVQTRQADRDKMRAESEARHRAEADPRLSALVQHGTGQAEPTAQLAGDNRRPTAPTSLLATNSFVGRLEACGILTAEQARRLGPVGPVARATGLVIDTRLNGRRPRCGSGTAAPTPGTRPRVLTQDGATCSPGSRPWLARRPGRSGSSASSSTRAPTPNAPRFPGAQMAATTSAGPSHYGARRGAGLGRAGRDAPDRPARPRPGSVRSGRGFDDARRSQNVFTDIPVIEASFWLTAAGLVR